MSRLALALAAAALALMLPASVHGAGAQYNVLKCHPAYGSWSASEREYFANGGNYREVPLCENDQFRYAGVETTGGNNSGLYAEWRIPAASGTVISGITASVKLRRGEKHQAQYGWWDGFGQFHVLDGVDAPGTGWKPASYRGGFQASAVGVRLVCNDVCRKPSPEAQAYIRHIELFIQDMVDPAINNITGLLFSEGVWLRGTQRLAATGSDLGSGLEFLTLRANEALLQVGTAGCPNAIEGPYARRVVPCGASAAVQGDYDTDDGSLGFVNGANLVAVTAQDFAGNRTVRTARVLIDNAPPELAFANRQPEDDPELIRGFAADAHSGVADATILMRAVGTTDWEALETRVEDGEARARVDSLAYPAGDYEFSIRAGDVAGNSSESETRRDGKPMRLSFPLRESVHLRASVGAGASKRQVVPYGSVTRARGQLVDASGDPLADRQITVVEHFGAGALIRERVSEVTTDSRGHWESKLPAGPSRSVEVRFEGTPRYAPQAAAAGRLSVKSRASFATTRNSVSEGSAVGFRGRVGHVGARIPSGGKLVELQVRLGPKKWDTVGEAFRTQPSGRYRSRYRFGKHYTSDVRFQFRVKVQDEGGWPYKSATSRQRSVTIKAR